uniref:Uncharacterized protein n=1 Tax=Lotharella oceanica TaxID=641309 RepID=A0A7S2TPK8_9EUKA|mmetsp:Transcript_24075/g.45000  ORF Transcript_24075/g.45000 Transcript_24075/m.45000 type:complete len:101 (+) Transcript_24075:84-386(+)
MVTCGICLEKKPSLVVLSTEETEDCWISKHGGRFCASCVMMYAEKKINLPITPKAKKGAATTVGNMDSSKEIFEGPTKKPTKCGPISPTAPSTKSLLHVQ